MMISRLSGTVVQMNRLKKDSITKPDYIEFERHSVIQADTHRQTKENLPIVKRHNSWICKKKHRSVVYNKTKYLAFYFSLSYSDLSSDRSVRSRAISSDMTS